VCKWLSPQEGRTSTPPITDFLADYDTLAMEFIHQMFDRYLITSLKENLETNIVMDEKGLKPSIKSITTCLCDMLLNCQRENA